jgi:phage head maturation protease
MSVKPPDTQLIRDLVLAPIERGDITQQSFAFEVEEDEWDGLDKDQPVRTIRKFAQIFDVSPVTFPAYPDTDVALRRLSELKHTLTGSSKTAGSHTRQKSAALLKKIDLFLKERS